MKVSGPPVVLNSLKVCRVLIFLSTFSKDHPMKGPDGLATNILSFFSFSYDPDDYFD